MLIGPSTVTAFSLRLATLLPTPTFSERALRVSMEVRFQLRPATTVALSTPEIRDRVRFDGPCLSSTGEASPTATFSEPLLRTLGALVWNTRLESVTVCTFWPPTPTETLREGVTTVF